MTHHVNRYADALAKTVTKHMAEVCHSAGPAFAPGLLGLKTPANQRAQQNAIRAFKNNIRNQVSALETKLEATRNPAFHEPGWSAARLEQLTIDARELRLSLDHPETADQHDAADNFAAFCATYRK